VHPRVEGSVVTEELVSRHLPRPQRQVRAWTGVREDFIELRSRHQAPPRPATLVRHKIGDHPTVHRHGERLTFGNRRMISALLLRSSDCRIVFPMRQP